MNGKTVSYVAGRLSFDLQLRRRQHFRVTLADLTLAGRHLRVYVIYGLIVRWCVDVMLLAERPYDNRLDTDEHDEQV